MSCLAVDRLASSVDEVQALPVPNGLGADLVLHEQVAGLAASSGLLHAELAVRMAALERAAGPVTDVRGDAIRAGLSGAVAGLLRNLGVFAAEHPAVEEGWLAGQLHIDHVEALLWGSRKLATPELREQLVAAVLPHLPPLDRRRARRLVGFTVDRLLPDDTDARDESDEAARFLDFAAVPGGGVAIDGYLPQADAALLTSAIDALVESLRVAGDGLTPGQRRADALTALVSIAGRRGLPSGGGLPAALTLTVTLAEAERVALRDPALFGTGAGTGAQQRGGSSLGGKPVGDATVRFGVCCAAVTPVLVAPPTSGSPLDRIAATPVQPLAVGRAVRLATTAQRKALQLRDGGCAIPGCCIGAAFTEPHHVVPWALGGPTDLDNLVCLCWVHHRMTELGRFRFIRRQPGDVPPPGALEHPLYWILPPLA